VNHVDIRTDESEEERTEAVFGRDTVQPDWGKGEGYYPPLDFFFLTFELFLPFRLQKELVGPHAETGTETFRVHQAYGFESPVTYIRPGSPKNEHDPSTSVAVVREYLRRELEVPRNGISFQFLGPSPFHADFYLKDGGHGLSEDCPFVGSVEETDGYDMVLVLYDSKVHSSIDDAMEDLFFELTGQLSLAYAAYAANARAVFRWDSLSAELDSLVGRTPSPRLARMKRALVRGRALSRLHQSLAEFEAGDVEDTHYLQRSQRQLYRSERTLSLQSLVTAAVEDRWHFPIQQVEKLIGHIESRHSRQVDILVVILAAILGGVIGSLATLMAHQ
jgi:hypothetical protein